MYSLDLSRQRFLDMIHRYLQGRLALFPFRICLPSEWAAEREAQWQMAWQNTRVHRCQEQAAQVKGELPFAEADDPRRFCRMLDRLCTLCAQADKEEAFRASVAELLAVCQHPETTVGEARYIAFPPRVPIFARPLPAGSKHQYPCSINDIRRQLALTPEYDLEGLWAIGLCPLVRDDGNAYGTYYRRKYPMRKPVILLHSTTDGFEFKARGRDDPGSLQQRFKVELQYGMQIERRGSSAFCRWPIENGRRYVVEHVLLHEIGHHVQYQQRWRAGYNRWLPTRTKEQFADDYAIRFQRERKE